MNKIKRVRKLVDLLEWVICITASSFVLFMVLDFIKYGYRGEHYILIGYSVILLILLLVRHMSNQYLIKLKLMRKLKSYEDSSVNRTNSYEKPHLRVVR